MQVTKSEHDSPRASVARRKESSTETRQKNIFRKPIDLDDILVKEIGQFGRYQIINILLVAFPIILSTFINEYIFSAAAIPHRCRITECGEDSKDNLFKPEWILNAIPGSNNINNFSSCNRFASQGNGTLDICPLELFTDTTVDCGGEFVYERNNSVVYDFNLGCEDWLRALAGTLSSLGTLLVLPITGYISDKYGRRIALIISVINLGIFGLIRAFSVNYTMYLALQLIQTTLGAGAFTSSYIFATEFVGPRYRVLASAACSGLFAIGQIVLGTVAWIIQPWRYMLIVLHVPCFIIIFYYWLLHESVRWLLSKRKFVEAKLVLEKVAKVNKKQISEKSINALMNPPAPPPMADDETEKPGLIIAIYQSPILLRRVLSTPIWWITLTFVYYGLSINATGLSDTMYLNYILTCAIEIPGFVISVLILERIGRKFTVSAGFFFSAACNVAFAFTPEKLTSLRLVIYLLGKLGIAVVFPSVYLYTSELYPTQYRHSLLAFSSMIGRIGSITAPLTPVFMVYWAGIPSMLFAVMGALSGILVLTQPETLGTKMPDTLEEAEAIGRPESMRHDN